MKIKQLSENCLRFSVSSPDESRKKVDILIDPFGQDLKSVSLEADIVFLSDKLEEPAKISGKPFLISSAGEYEIGGVAVQGIDESVKKEKGEKTFYIIRAKDGKVFYLNGFTGQEFSAEQLEEIGSIDILVLVLGRNGLDIKAALNLISQIEPKMVIFCQGGIKKEELDKFIKDFESKGLEKASELDIKLEELDEEKKRFALLSPSR